jgi:hypothetical protein
MCDGEPWGQIGVIRRREHRAKEASLMDQLNPTPPAEAGAPSPPRLSGARRAIATLALAAGLLAVGGVSAVMAASPDPSASTAPSASQGTGSGSGGTTTHKCPAAASSSSSGTSSSSGGSTTN